MSKRVLVAALSAAVGLGVGVGPAWAVDPIPNLKIRKDGAGSYIGGGAGQNCHADPPAVRAKRRVGKAGAFDVLVKNIGPGGTVNVRQASTSTIGDPVYGIKYFRGGTNISAAVKGGGKDINLDNGEKRALLVRIKIRSGSDPGDQIAVCVEGTPNADAVVATVEVV